MMKLTQLLFAIATLTSPVLQAATVYNNTANDAFDSIFFSMGGYSEIGDAISLDGTERLLSQASIQLFNLGSDGAFDVALRFYLPGSPVGAQFGGIYTLSNQFAPSLGVIDLTFSDLALLYPNDDLIFTVEVSNVAVGVDLGLNLFDPLNIAGSSSTSSLITRTSQFAETAAGANSNLYFLLEAESAPLGSDVPEPSTVLLTALPIAILLIRRKLALT